MTSILNSGQTLFRWLDHFQIQSEDCTLLELWSLCQKSFMAAQLQMQTPQASTTSAYQQGFLEPGNHV